MQSTFLHVCVFIRDQLKASRSNWQVFFLVKKRNEDNIKDSFSYEETRRFSKRHFFFNSSASIIFLMASYKSD